jgi:hypothetical protein
VVVSVASVLYGVVLEVVLVAVLLVVLSVVLLAVVLVALSEVVVVVTEVWGSFGFSVVF